jgi:hypothetical protein
MKHCHLKDCKGQGTIPTVIGHDICWYCKNHSYLVEFNEWLRDFVNSDGCDKLIREAVDFAEMIYK